MGVHEEVCGRGRGGWWSKRLSSGLRTGGEGWHRWLNRRSGHLEWVSCVEA